MKKKVEKKIKKRLGKTKIEQDELTGPPKRRNIKNNYEKTFQTC